jgi:hypothetical protein
LCSAGEAAEERGQLGGDTEDGAFEDADDGGDEAHENTLLSADAVLLEVLLVAAKTTYSSNSKLASNF